MSHIVRNTYTAIVFLLLAVLTSVHVANQLNPTTSVIDLPPEALFRILLAGRQTSTLSLYAGEERFGSAVIQTSIESGSSPTADLQVDASGAFPNSPQKTAAWAFLLRLSADRQAGRVESFSVEFNIRPTGITISARGSSKEPALKLSVSQNETPLFNFEGTPAELLARTALFVGWIGPLPSGELFTSESAWRAIRTSRRVGGDRLEVIEVGLRDDPKKEVKLIITQVGLVLYLRLTGGYDAILDGLAELDIKDLRSSK